MNKHKEILKYNDTIERIKFTLSLKYGKSKSGGITKYTWKKGNLNIGNVIITILVTFFLK